MPVPTTSYLPEVLDDEEDVPLMGDADRKDHSVSIDMSKCCPDDEYYLHYGRQARNSRWTVPWAWWRWRHEYDDSTDMSNGLLTAYSSDRLSLSSCSRSGRKCSVLAVLARATMLSLAAFLMLFGLLHIAQVLFARSHVFWTQTRDYDDFMPGWGKTGNPGDGLSHYPTDATRDVIPISCHSHNDYWRRVPLFDALHWGCTSVEADVWLIDDDLYVGHSRPSLTRQRTFRSLYIDPLVELLDTMNPQTEFANTTGHGVFDEDPSQTLVLLVDIKTSGPETFDVVEAQLDALRQKDYLTYFDGEQMHQRAITVVGTGKTPFDQVTRNATRRDIFFDAPLSSLMDPTGTSIGNDEMFEELPQQDFRGGQGTTGVSPNLSPDSFNITNSYYASVSFARLVGTVWRGRLNFRQKELIVAAIRGAHRHGLKARFWDTPAWPVNVRNHIWQVLIKEGADVLNVDDLRAAATEDWTRRIRHGWFW